MLTSVGVLRTMWSYKICCRITKYTEIWNSWKVKLRSWKQKARTRILVTFMLTKINLRRITNLRIAQ